MADTTETQWFKIIVFISAGFFAGLFLANIIYYNRLRSGQTLSHGEAVSMLWLNIILFILAIILFIWALIRLILRQDVRQTWSDQAYQYGAKYMQSTNGGFTFSQVPPSQVVLTPQTQAVAVQPVTTVAPTMAVPAAPVSPVVVTNSLPAALPPPVVSSSPVVFGNV